MDKQIDRLDKKYPEINLLRTAPGVGPVVAACYVFDASIRKRWKPTARPGAYLGLRPRQATVWRLQPAVRHHQDGQYLPAQLLVQSAQYILAAMAPDSELRRWGLKLAASGGKRGKKRAVVAGGPQSWP